MKKNPFGLSKKQKRTLILISAIFLLLVGILSLFFMPFFNRLSEPAFQVRFQQWAIQQTWKGQIFVLLIQMIQVIIAFIPGEAVELLAGFLYGPWLGLLLSLTGCLIASACVFAFVRKFGTKLLKKIFRKDSLEEYDFLQNSKKIEIITFVLFLIPGTPKDLLTYVAGASPIRMSTFLILSTFARIPSILSSTFMGATFGEGNFGTTAVVFLLTAAVGFFGIFFKDSIINFCHKLSRERKR